MSKACEERQNASAGRGLFIIKDLKPGALVLQDKTPFVAVLDSPVLTKACSWCFRFSDEADLEDGITVSACTGCKVVRYCGKACQALSWKHSHKYECKVFKTLHPQVLPNTARMILQILLRHKNNVVPKEDWDAFLKLRHHMDDLEKGSRTGNEYQQQALENVQLMARAGKEYSRSSENPAFVESLVGRKLITNTLTLTSPIFTPLGLVLSLSMSLLNHSCNPNAAIVYNGRIADLRVLEPMKSGMELHIAYTQTTLSVAARRSELQNRYHFTCNCDQCSQNLTLNQPDELSSMHPSLSPSRASLEAEVAGLLIEAKSLPAAEGLIPIAKAYSLFNQYPRYPVWLSPLHQLRFDLIMALQANRYWVAAFIQSMILHWNVLPMVHPQRSHPTRVARGWVHVKIASHIGGLANEPDFAASMNAIEEGDVARMLAVKFGFDWGLVVYVLIKDVSDQVLKSHGLESRFSMEVGREMGKMKQEASKTRGEPSDQDLEKTRALLCDVANEGWDWWTRQMRERRDSQKLLMASGNNHLEDGLSILLG